MAPVTKFRGTHKVCELTADALPLWDRLVRAAARRNPRLVKKASRALERLGRTQNPDRVFWSG